MKLLSTLTIACLLLSLPAQAEKAMFAGGSFWCSEADFEGLRGVKHVVSGYTGGNVENPLHEDILAGKTGHYEAVEVEFDPAVISYAQLLDFFWRNIDPFDQRGQFCDKGDMYLSAIFPLDASQRAQAEASYQQLQELAGRDKAVATRIITATTFYPAASSHQDYYKNNPTKYQQYRWRCGRDQRLQELWGKASF